MSMDPGLRRNGNFKFKLCFQSPGAAADAYNHINTFQHCAHGQAFGEIMRYILIIHVDQATCIDVIKMIMGSDIGIIEGTRGIHENLAQQSFSTNRFSVLYTVARDTLLEELLILSYT